MQSAMRLTLLLATALPLSACAGSTQLLAPTAGCSTLIPETWKADVPSAVLPTDEDETRRWQVFGVAQTGQLRIANGRTKDVIEVVTACEARDAEAVRTITRPWWQIWPG